jgi:hypothetical protein
VVGIVVVVVVVGNVVVVVVVGNGGQISLIQSPNKVVTIICLQGLVIPIVCEQILYVKSWVIGNITLLPLQSVYDTVVVQGAVNSKQ